MPLARLVALALLAGAVSSFVTALLRPRPRPHAVVTDLTVTDPDTVDVRRPSSLTPGHAA